MDLETCQEITKTNKKEILVIFTVQKYFGKTFDQGISTKIKISQDPKI